MRIFKAAIAVSIALLLGACSEVGETTAVGAATGGVIGAGLGAVIGSQTGNAGAGIAIGAVAGASAGAAIGDALEKQDKALARQDETISRQERRITAQSSEIDELRRGQGESHGSGSKGRSLSEPTRSGSYAYNSTKRDSSLSRDYQKKYVGTTSRSAYQKAPRSYSGSSRGTSAVVTAPKRESGGVSEKTLVAAEESSAKNGSSGSESAALSTGVRESAVERLTEPAALAEPKLAASAKASEPAADDCEKAAIEVGSAERAQEAADRLFHYRRALRLCPQKAEYHNRLGEAYLSINRNQDAEYEFKEALNLDPSFTAAKENLSSIKK